MDKINFRFALLQARFPVLYQEAENKIAGGVDRKDVLADWLTELTCWRNSVVSTDNNNVSSPSQEDTISEAKNIMAGLK